MTAILLALVAAAQWAWSWLSSILLALAAELLLTRLRRRWRRVRGERRAEARRAWHRVRARRLG